MKFQHVSAATTHGLGGSGWVKKYFFSRRVVQPRAGHAEVGESSPTDVASLSQADTAGVGPETF